LRKRNLAPPAVAQNLALNVLMRLDFLSVTRSARYLQSVAAGKQRRDLQGAPVEDVSPQHIYLALLELFRRRQSRSRVDLRPTFRVQLMAAF